MYAGLYRHKILFLPSVVIFFVQYDNYFGLT